MLADYPLNARLSRFAAGSSSHTAGSILQDNASQEAPGSERGFAGVQREVLLFYQLLFDRVLGSPLRRFSEP
jgi:hypothetical protein